MSNRFTVYSFVGSQWAGVAHLALAEKGFDREEYDLKEIDLGAAENFDPAYLRINPNGTVPSLTSPNLSKPLSESTDILRYLDNLRNNASLVPTEEATKQRGQAIIDLVHSADVDTNVILLQARDEEELLKRISDMGSFMSNRQKRLEAEHAADPSHPFYKPKMTENGAVHKFYSEVGPQHREFFDATHHGYQRFAKGMEKLEELLVLPYATGVDVTEADFHVVPWLSHAMMAAGTVKTEIQNLSTLETEIQKSVPEFNIGPKTKEWWFNISSTASFKQVFRVLH